MLRECLSHSPPKRFLEHDNQLLSPPSQHLDECLIALGQLMLLTDQPQRYLTHAAEPLAERKLVRPRPQQGPSGQCLWPPTAIVAKSNRRPVDARQQPLQA